MALDKALSNIARPDLERLIEGQTPEGMTLEYKEDLPLDRPEEKKEFLRDLTAFANTRGGDIVCGIKEDPETRVPTELCGMSVSSFDQWKQRLENIICDGINPKLYGTQIGDPISVADDRFAIVIRIPRSFDPPHMVVSGGDYRFYYRTNAGKQRLDVSGLRTLFGMADNIKTQARAFRAERLAMIEAGDTPVPLKSGPKCVLHLVPFDAFASQARYDLSRFADHPEDLAKAGRWLASRGFERCRYNFEGLVAYVPHSNEAEPRIWYTQCFRNGIIEAVNMEHDSGMRVEGEHLVTTEYEGYVARAIQAYLAIHRDMNVAPPVFGLLAATQEVVCKLVHFA